MSAEDRAAATDRLRLALLAFRAAQGLVLQAHRGLKGRPQAEADAFRDGTVQRLGVYAASAHCRPEPGDGSNSWPKPEPSAPL